MSFDALLQMIKYFWSLLVDQVCFSVSKDLDICCKDWSRELFNLFCFPFLDEVLDISCWLRWAGSYVFHVYMDLFSIAQATVTEQAHSDIFPQKLDQISCDFSMSLGFELNNGIIGESPRNLVWGVLTLWKIDWHPNIQNLWMSSYLERRFLQMAIT